MGIQDHLGQAIKLFQAPWKTSFTFHFWHESYVLDDMKLAESSNNSSERMNVTFWGSKHTLTLLATYYQGDKTPNLQDLWPCLQDDVLMVRATIGSKTAEVSETSKITLKRGRPELTARRSLTSTTVLLACHRSKWRRCSLRCTRWVEDSILCPARRHLPPARFGKWYGSSVK